MQCLVLAAGLGSRLNSLGASKPLTPLCGRPLIGRVLDAVAAAGCSEAIVVTGHLTDKVEDWLGDAASEIPIPVRTLRNERYQEPNGLSVTAARALMQGPYLMSMCDHMFDPAIARDLKAFPVQRNEVVLAVDYRLENPDVDMDDVTRVQVIEPDRSGQIANIGKGIATYNAFDTGLFLVNDCLAEAILAAEAAGEAPSISAGMMRLANQGRARTFDIGDRYWIDVDDEAAYAKAQAHYS